MDEDVLAVLEGCVDAVDGVVEVRPEILRLEIEDIEAVALIALLLQLGQPGHVEDLDEGRDAAGLEDGGVEDGGKRAEEEGAGVGVRARL
jgi:hypothetical protein